MKGMKELSLTLVLGAFVLAEPAGAAITNLTNGDFETSPANSNGPFPAPWYSGHPNNWQEFRYAGLGGYTGTAAAFGWQSGQNGYIYQSVGTLAGETGVTLDGTVYNRTNGNRVGDFDVSFWYTAPGAFTPAETSDIAAAGTQIGSAATFTEGGNLTTVTTGSTPTSEAFSHKVYFTGSGISAGDEVWVRLGDAINPFGNDEPFIDALSVSGTTTPPPPPPPPPTASGPTLGSVSHTGAANTWPSPEHFVADTGATSIGSGPWGRNGVNISVAVDGNETVYALFENDQLWSFPSLADFGSTSNPTQIGVGPWGRDATQLSIAADTNGTIYGLFENNQLWSFPTIGDFANSTNGTQIGVAPWGGDEISFAVDDDGTVYGLLGNLEFWSFPSITDFANSANGTLQGTMTETNGITSSIFAIGIAETVIIPEPSTFLIWALGLIGLAWYARRRRTT